MHGSFEIRPSRGRLRWPVEFLDREADYFIEPVMLAVDPSVVLATAMPPRRPKGMHERSYSRHSRRLRKALDARTDANVKGSRPLSTIRCELNASTVINPRASTLLAHTAPTSAAPD